MPVNVIGLLNISIDKEEFEINRHIKLVSREYFENRNISMPTDIRFYKTFIVSTYDFGPSFDMSKVPGDERDALPTFLLWAFKLFITHYDIVNSEWFAGDSFESLKEYVKVSSQDPILSTGLLEDWVSAFKIDNMVHNVSMETVEHAANLYYRIVELYKVQEKSPEDINLHWLYAFTKFQDCCAQPNSRYSVLYITSALEFLLVNTSNESEFRAAYYASLVYTDDYEERTTCYNFLKWAYSVRQKLSEASVLDASLFIDKSSLPDNIYKLREILAGVLLKTLGMTNKELQEKINEMIFSCPAF